MYKILVCMYQCTWCHISEDHYLIRDYDICI
jgi:hypothetical protein